MEGEQITSWMSSVSQIDILKHNSVSKFTQFVGKEMLRADTQGKVAFND